MVVVGQVARDLVLTVERAPGAGQAVAVGQRREMLGGKGANQAVSVRQLGMGAVLVGVVGADRVGGWLVEMARRDGIDVRNVVRRPNTPSGLIVDVVDDRGQWRYLEDLPEAVLLTEADVERAGDCFGAAGTVLIQLQQPAAVALRAARLARAAGCRVVLDGAPGDPRRRADLLAAADVVRADTREAGLLTGTTVRGGRDALAAARDLLRCGPSLVAVGAGADGNALAWPGGSVLLPLLHVDVVDTTGAGDAFVAALVVALAHGDPPEDAGRLATAAAALCVTRPGGRPDLSPDGLRTQLARLPG